MKNELAIVAAAGLATTIIILTALILYDIGKMVESIAMHASDTELVDSPAEFKWSYNVTADRVITLPDKDMNWQELLAEAYQQGYDHGVKDSINHQPSK